MFQEIMTKDIEHELEKERMINEKYMSISMPIRKVLVTAILELESELVFSRNRRQIAVDQVEDLIAFLFEHLNNNSDFMMDTPKPDTQTN